MAVMGKYCKAYPISELEQYPRWAPKPIDAEDDNDGIPAEYVFLQDNFTVTRGVFLDERIVFDEVSPEWKQFCADVLKFELPEYVSANDDDTLIVDGNEDQSGSMSTAGAEGEMLERAVGAD